MAGFKTAPQSHQSIIVQRFQKTIFGSKKGDNTPKE